MFPVCMKDLTFIHLGNQTQDNGLVIIPQRSLVSQIISLDQLRKTPHDLQGNSGHCQYGFVVLRNTSPSRRRTGTSLSLSFVQDMSTMFDSPTSHAHIFAGFGAHQSTTDSSGTIRRHTTSNRLLTANNPKRIYDEVKSSRQPHLHTLHRYVPRR